MKSPVVAFYPMSAYARDVRKLRHFFVSHFEEESGPAFDRFVPHRHDFFEIFWIRSGTGQLRLDLETYDFGPGSLLFIAPRRVHSWKIDTPVEGEITGFTEEFFSVDSSNARLLAKLPFSYNPSLPAIFHVEGSKRAEVDQLYADLRRESENDGVGREDLVRARTTILLVHLHRFHQARTAPVEAPPASLLAWRFRLKLEEHFPQLLKVSDYARLLQVSRSHLNQGLNHEIGQSASELIHERLVLEAKRLLMHSTLTVSEIAYRLQFRDPSYFVRFFRRQTKVTPGQYRAEIERSSSTG